jgi:hypothetical protein
MSQPTAPEALPWLVGGVLLIGPGALISYLVAPSSLFCMAVMVAGVVIAFVGSVLNDRLAARGRPQEPTPPAG